MTIFAPSTSTSTPSQPIEIVIIGGGLIGVSTAYYLSRHPNLHNESKITLVEEENVGTGSSGYSSGLLSSSSTSRSDGSKYQGEGEELSKEGFQLHQTLSKDHEGDLKWGYKLTESYHATINPSSSNTSSNSTDHSSPISFLPTAQSIEYNTSSSSSSTSTAIRQPSDFIRHLCGLFLTHPGASLIIAKATSATFTDTSSEQRDATDGDSKKDGITSIVGDEISSIIPNGTSSRNQDNSKSENHNKGKKQRGRRINGINAIQIINGVEEIIHLKADLVILSNGLKLPGLLKTFLATPHSNHIGISKSLGSSGGLGIRNWETVVLKPRAKLDPCVVKLTLSGGSNLVGEDKRDGEAEVEVEIIVRDDGKVICSRPLPSSSNTQPPQSDFLKLIESISPKFKTSNGTLILSQAYWSSTLTPNHQPLFGELSDKDVDVDGIWFGIGGNTAQGPAISSRLANSILSI